MPDFTLTIGGQNVAGAARPIPVIDPSTGQAFTESPAATVPPIVLSGVRQGGSKASFCLFAASTASNS